MYQQEKGGGFYLLVRPQNLGLEPGAKWAVVDSLDPKKHEIHLWSQTGGTGSPIDNLETGDSVGKWYFNNNTKNDGYSRSMEEGSIKVKCFETK